MSFDKELEEEDNRSSCSLDSNTSSGSHSMLLRSSCKSAKCTVKEHNVTSKRHRSHVHSSFDKCCQDLSSVVDLEAVTLSSRTRHSKISQYRNQGLFTDTSSGISRNIEDGVRSSTVLKSLQVSHQVSSIAESLASCHSSSSVNGNVMARTIYKTRSFTQSLSPQESNDNENGSFFRENSNAYYHNGLNFNDSLVSHRRRIQQRELASERKAERYTATYSDSTNFFPETFTKRIKFSSNVSGDEDLNVQNIVNESKQKNSFWSVLFWRKYLYLSLSKPTHWDVELLDRIRMFGKVKTAVLLLVLLLLLLLSGFLSSTVSQLKQNPLLPVPFEGECNSAMLGWWPLNRLLSRFAASVIEQPKFESSTPDGSSQTEKDGAISIESIDIISKPSAIDQVVLADSITVQETHEYSDEHMKSINTITRDELRLLIQNIVREEKLLEKDKQQESEAVETIQKELEKLTSRFDALSDMQKRIKDKENNHVKLAFENQQLHLEQKEQLSKIDGQVNSLQQQFVILEALLGSAKNCCHNETVLDKRSAAVLLSMLSDDDNSPLTKFLKTWISSRYVTNERLNEKLSNLEMASSSSKDAEQAEIKVMVKSMIGEYIKSKEAEAFVVNSRYQETSSGSLSVDEVRAIVRQAIQLYDEDKTGLADYALESGGGAVVNTRCSETYNNGVPSLVIFGINLWNVKNTPRYAIQPDMSPGHCWAFKGSLGYLVVELSSPIRPTAFTIEHIPKSLSTSGSIDSAPRQFIVLGLKHENGKDSKVLGEYKYDKDGEPLQRFPVQVGDAEIYPFIELQIQSNHGNLHYTCLYRFRVHGVRS